MTDLREAEAAVTGRRDQVAGRLAALRGRIGELAGRRSEAIRGGEYVSAEVLHAEQAEVEREHDLLSRHAAELDAAHHEASAARQRSDWIAQRDQALAQRDQALGTARQMADRLKALLAEAVETVKAGAAAERAARDAAGTAHGLDDALDPPPQHNGMLSARPFTPPPAPMSQALSRDPLLTQMFSKYL